MPSGVEELGVAPLPRSHRGRRAATSSPRRSVQEQGIAIVGAGSHDRKYTDVTAKCKSLHIHSRYAGCCLFVAVTGAVTAMRNGLAHRTGNREGGPKTRPTARTNRLAHRFASTAVSMTSLQDDPASATSCSRSRTNSSRRREDRRGSSLTRTTSNIRRHWEKPERRVANGAARHTKLRQNDSVGVLLDTIHDMQPPTSLSNASRGLADSQAPTDGGPTFYGKTVWRCATANVDGGGRRDRDPLRRCATTRHRKVWLSTYAARRWKNGGPTRAGARAQTTFADC